MDQIYHPIHGFSRTPHPFQFVVAILFLLNFCLSTYVIVSETQITYKIVIGTFFYFSVIPVIYYYLTVSGSDPTDRMVMSSKKLSEGNNDHNSMVYFFCDICKCDVGAKSKHCNICNRCTEQFDHHCKWVNNCIGGINYKEFVRLLNWGVAYLTIYCVILVKQLFLDQIKTYALVLETISLVINIIVIIFVSCLVIFHIWLRSQKISTYDWVVGQRQQKSKTPRISQVGIYPASLDEHNQQTAIQMMIIQNQAIIKKSTSVIKSTQNNDQQMSMTRQKQKQQDFIKLRSDLSISHHIKMDNVIEDISEHKQEQSLDKQQSSQTSFQQKQA